MAVTLAGNGGTVAECDGTTFRTLRTVSRPIEYGAGGHYSVGALSGVIAAGTTGELFQFRWTSSALLAVINRIRLSACVSTTYFAATTTTFGFAIYKSVGWSANGTGGTSLSIGTSGKERTSMASSAVGDFRVATTAALGAGTKTLDTYPIAGLCCPGPVSGGGTGEILLPTSLFEANVENGVHPLVLAQNEGFSFSTENVPATGTWQFALEIQWAEVAQY